MSTYTEPVTRVETKRGHHYVDGNGVKIPGVTTLIKGFMPTPALIRWASNTTAAYAVDHWDELAEADVTERLETLKKSPWMVRDAAANKGTEIHALAERLTNGEEVDVPPELAGHITSCVAFLDEWDVRPLLTESVVYSLSTGYAGSLDLVAELNDGRTWILDFKTGKGVYADAALQLAAYANAEVYLEGDTPTPLPQIHAAGVVHLRADGYSLVPMNAGPDTFKVFRHGCMVARWNDVQEKARRSGGGVVGDPIEPVAVSA